MSKGSILKDLILDPQLLVMPGVFDTSSAKLAEQAGYTALQCSGAAISGFHCGRPDYSLISLDDMAACTARIVRSVDVPVMADGDNGFGNAVSSYYTVRSFEDLGAAGINLEDQLSPKRCGHLAGKELISLEEAVSKIHAAADARRDPDFVINARTDALAVEGLPGVIRRGNAYLRAGATMIFVEGVTSREEIRHAVNNIQGPVAVNIVEGGKSPERLTLTELQELGIARVSLPGVLLLAALGGMRETLARIRKDGDTAGLNHLLLPFRDAHKLFGMSEVEELEARYLA
ncbi:isocitrate lyase/PEP mutase family protein [Mycobacterium montefiorense]|uniref:Carboxyvinyl-carboxyphosphonate phosphorylmutase n=1 Tax=Mycobacterium montefiorense TaxID=154654 RepID=A0AA37USC4_9MYCO|nr:oxaloacetate decarboxylase [Mycobacterium montefiorense]GBG38352.1 carboxyvinyl-carboxyphosphonate phosphorylmutase [Mycobacterium montefiorense]GKU34181.1 carboxyvinyl-carboxyphosphonate phosphorylmutase [Mycobacterium montefiorense]GKU38799.1 carboxyvinyl-carboxyphosphonate phosphorylmutase [Mycobacterium montefiorense]GKU48164.1 carboxyvinyl-carboxyphosphonate phosphorylmutase [Mycobacterium montefiorense]GKU49563.1 carboxyvinyl-carboxyphosphonate phosphorylmutase [Mycobacterium montefio